MIFTANKGQTSYGEAIGILLLDTTIPFIQGDVGNATSYDYPVRYKTVEGLTGERIFNHDYSFIDKMVAGAKELEQEGVKAITGDCGFMAIFNREVKESVNIPVFLSSLLQIPFIRSTLPDSAKIGIITANSKSLTSEVFEKIGILDKKNLVIYGLEEEKNFKEAAIDEIGTLDSDEIRDEVLCVAKKIISEHPETRS
ncbi:aspartate/glutamate racemase family protein, partial [Desulfobacula sp.]|uniref:aspartate/glutamate racemase family protein n=1 Tax=Desulfobacula sp. TaxID=2593537 RepID=UPI001DEFA4B5|nr:aspartate/glutamate racemase family protein [Desulfobacula sp.]